MMPAHDSVRREVSIPAGREAVQGDLVIPPGPVGLVLFAHGSGSSRFSERNRTVATVLQNARLGTLLMDLLTAQEEDIDRYSRQYRFDIELLGRRVVAVVDWVATTPALSSLPVACFGASTGAAAALIAAAERPAEVRAALVSVRAAIEVCDTRFAAWARQDEWCRLADQACHGALVVGTGTADVAAVQPLAQGVDLWVNESVAVQHATWGNPAGDPLRLLVWLANEGAHSLGGLRAGQWVTTGSCTGTLLVAPGTRVVADFPGLGRAELVFD